MSGGTVVATVTRAWRELALAVLTAGVAALIAVPALAEPEGLAEPAGLPEPGDLSLADPAGQVLVGVTLRPAVPGDNQVWVHLQPPVAAAPAEDLDVEATVDGQPVALRRCGPACRRGEAELTGGERLAVRVAGEAGGTASLRLPRLPTADGGELVERATARMTALDSYRVQERLGPADPPVRSRLRIAAPDRLRMVTEPGRVLVRIDDRIYSRGPDARWWNSRRAPSLEVPDHIWDEDDAAPVAARIVGSDRIDDTPVDVVAFFLHTGGHAVWYRLWVDEDDLVHAAEMLTGGHFMHHRYFAFDEPVTIEAPYGPAGRAAVALFGDPPEAFWQAGAAVARWLGFAGVLAAAGGAAFLAWAHDRRSVEHRPLARGVALAAVAGMVAALGEIGLRVAAVGGGLAGLADADVWTATLAGGTAGSLALRGVGVAVLLGALPRLWSPWAIRLALAAGAVLTASLLPTGHSVAADPLWPALAADYAHVVAATGWFGGLVLLTGTLRLRRAAGQPPPAGVVVAFSRVALASVGLLVAAGVGLAWVHAGTLSALVTTAYGRALAVKLALVAVVIALAAYNRLRLVPAIRAGSESAWPRLRRTTAAELTGLIAVLAVTGALVNVNPPT